MPDGKAILYARYGPFEGEIVRHGLAGSEPDQVLLRLPGTWLCPWSISPNGRLLVVSRYVPETGADLLLVDLETAPGAAASRTIVATPLTDAGAAISPNGEWLAYFSGDQAQREVFIEKFPGGGQKTRVSSGNAGPPAWSRDGREIYYASGARAGGDLDLMAARVELTPVLHVSEPRRLFSGRFVIGHDMGLSHSVMRDGRFLMVRTQPGVPASTGTGYAPQLLVVQNWFADLRRSQQGKGP
jgi:Tol biopolymer transport system component